MYPFIVGSKDEEQGDVYDLDDDAEAVDGGDEVAAGLDEAIVCPEGWIQQCANVGKAWEFLSSLVLHYPQKCLPANSLIINSYIITKIN